MFLYSYGLFTLMINPAAILHGSFIALITQQFELLINYIAFSTKIDFPRFCLNKICTQIRVVYFFVCLKRNYDMFISTSKYVIRFNIFVIWYFIHVVCFWIGFIHCHFGWRALKEWNKKVAYDFLINETKKFKT